MAPKAKTREKQASPSHAFDAELAELESLSTLVKAGTLLDEDGTKHLRRTLAHRNNFLVSKAAKLAAECQLTQLLPEILSAYDRFFHDPAKSDPKCWAKESLAKALVKLGHRGKDEYLRGMRHHQMEPSFGPDIDTAGTLRGTCAHALVDCPGISDSDLLSVLLEPLTDHDKAVRMDAARAIANVGGISAALLLRLRVLLGPARRLEDEPEALGAASAALLSLDSSAIPLIANALKAEDDFAAEAAFALADLRTPEALAPLLAHLRDGADLAFSPTLLTAVTLTRLPEAFAFLLELIARNAREAPDALEALSRIAPSDDFIARIAEAVDQADSLRVKQAFARFSPDNRRDPMDSYNDLGAQVSLLKPGRPHSFFTAGCSCGWSPG